ncbi:MAG: hypothetical protein ACT4R6_02850, partial [Gemmatimonadaceae bacterium]
SKEITEMKRLALAAAVLLVAACGPRSEEAAPAADSAAPAMPAQDTPTAMPMAHDSAAPMADSAKKM